MRTSSAVAPVREPGELSALYAEAAAATAAGSKSFFFATRFFPPDLARSAHAVYWFCRTTDDLVDEASSVEQGRRDLAEWEQAVRSGFMGVRPQNPILRTFFDTVDRHQIPSEYPLDLIEGCRMDLNQVRYRNFSELRVFCYRVASTVGLMMCRVIGFRKPELEEAAIPKAIDLGIAMQLTNILRDVGDDLRMGRIYLPGDEMEQYGYSPEDLAACRINDPFRRLMAAQAKRARDYYASAEPGIAMLNPRGAYSVKIASDVYRQILAVIERNQYQVFERRAVVPSVQKYWLTLRSMALPVARHAAGSAFSRLTPWKS